MASGCGNPKFLCQKHRSWDTLLFEYSVAESNAVVTEINLCCLNMLFRYRRAAMSSIKRILHREVHLAGNTFY